MSTSVIDIATQAYQDQKPGTSGLRKRVTVFEQSNYVENFIQATLEANAKPKFLVLGGDGRYYSDVVITKIISICAANGVERLIIGKDGILSTPAASAIIRSMKADGGIILTASHNPGGPEGDFGIKYNIANGGPAPQAITDHIYEITKSITSYKSLYKRPKIDPSQIGTTQVAGMTVEVVDPVDIYLNLMKQVFDFDKIKTLFEKSQFKIFVDCMNGVMGPYARRILVEELGAPEASLVNDKPLPDFGGLHPDPNLVHATRLVEHLKTHPDVQLGVAFDGDGDRNMILGQEAFFVSPGDSLAVIAAQSNHIKFFDSNADHGERGYARSFPTSSAIDRVAAKNRVKCYEVPTGWKYFGNLMDADLIVLCGEESFGTGSSHIREKDGLWACLAWLSIIANTGKTVKELVEAHWAEFGRDYFLRLDFEECDLHKSQLMIRELDTAFCTNKFVGKKYGADDRYIVNKSSNFEYVDPIDKTITGNQGLYLMFMNNAKVVIRLSGTGSCGATVRLYVSEFSKDNLDASPEIFLSELIEAAYSITNLKAYTGRDRPTVMT